MESIPQKTCTKCGETHPATPEYFCTQKRSADGLHSWCKACNIKRGKEWRANNRDKVLANKKRYRERHPERVNEQKKRAVAKKPEHYQAQQRVWREENAEHVKRVRHAAYERNSDAKRKYSTDWYWANLDRARAQSKKFRALNQDHIREAKREYALANKEQIYAYQKEWREKNPDIVRRVKREQYNKNRPAWKRYAHEYRTRKYKADGYWTQADIDELYETQQGRCGYCGIRLIRGVDGEVTIDHMHSLKKGGSNWSDNLCLCCETCNKSKWIRSVQEWKAVRGW